MMCPQLSTPYLATSPQVQKLSDRQYQQELFVSHRKHKKTETHKQKQKHTENWQQDAKFWRSSSWVEILPCFRSATSHFKYRQFAECSLYTDLHIMKLPFYVQLCTMSSPWQWLPFTSPSGRQSLSSSYTGTNHFLSLSGDLGIGLVWDNRTGPAPHFGPTVEILFQLN